MTLKEELHDLEVAATMARAQNFPGLADAFERVADNLRTEMYRAAHLDSHQTAATAVTMTRAVRSTTGATVAA